MHWTLLLQEYKITIKHINGRESIISDTLTGNSTTYNFTEDYDTGNIITLNKLERMVCSRKVIRHLENIRPLP